MTSSFLRLTTSGFREDLIGSMSDSRTRFQSKNFKTRFSLGNSHSLTVSLFHKRKSSVHWVESLIITIICNPKTHQMYLTYVNAIKLEGVWHMALTENRHLEPRNGVFNSPSLQCVEGPRSRIPCSVAHYEETRQI